MASSITLPEFELPEINLTAQEDEDYDDQEYEEEEYEEGEDLDAEAEAMARRLGDQLLADIAKAQAEVAASTTVPRPGSATGQTIRKKRQASAILTMKSILALASHHPSLSSAMSATKFSVPNGLNSNLMDVFNRCVSSSSISKPLARALTEAVLVMAKSHALVCTPQRMGIPLNQDQSDNGKRKRGQDDPDDRFPDYPQKRIAVPIDQPDLLSQIGEAIRVVTRSLTNHHPAHAHSINPAVISSIQLQLHQLFLFAVTSAPRAGDGRMHALQELAGLVQMLGVLSGINIGNAPPPWHGPPGSVPPLPPPPPDIGTAVYPCLVPGCPKTFHRLYSLRAHQRLHTLEHRPYRCGQCPASFVRNHDLKRHALLHEKKAWRCAGCNKIFSRRDAIKRHKDARGRASATGGKNRSGDADSTVDAACAYAEIEVVEVDKIEGEEEISRRAKLWNGIAASSAGTTMAEHMGPEEGEVDPAIIYQAQNMIMGIHGLLQAEVSKGMGTPALPAPMPPPHVSQSTLASIIARAQQPVVPVDTGTAGPSNSSMTPPVVDTPMEVDVPNTQFASPAAGTTESTPPTLSLSWLSEEQTRLLEQAIAHAASAAQAQAEAEAALEEEDEEFEEEEAEEQDIIGNAPLVPT